MTDHPDHIGDANKMVHVYHAQRAHDIVEHWAKEAGVENILSADDKTLLMGDIHQALTRAAEDSHAETEAMRLRFESERDSVRRCAAKVVALKAQLQAMQPVRSSGGDEVPG
jgi:hypothetical protein